MGWKDQAEFIVLMIVVMDSNTPSFPSMNRRRRRRAYLGYAIQSALRSEIDET